MALSDSFIDSMLESWASSERYVNEALQQLAMGNDGDATYHPLYKAWRSLQNNPEQLKSIHDYGKFGTGLMIFLSYGTVTDIDDQQQLASISYLFLSKAIKESPTNVNLIKNRLVLMISNHEAFEYTVSSVVRKDDDFMSYNLFPFTARDAMFKMEYSDLSSDSRLLGIDLLSYAYRDLGNKIVSGFFGRNATETSIIATGNQCHEDVLAYLENKVIVEGDIVF